jgi:hypothetical protein
MAPELGLQQTLAVSGQDSTGKLSSTGCLFEVLRPISLLYQRLSIGLFLIV